MRCMRRLLLAAILAGLLFLQGCQAQEPIKIGYVANLSGRSSELGVSGRNAMQLAVDQVNASGGIQGRSVQLIIKDDKNDPAVAVKVDEEFYQEGVVAVIGHLTSQVMEQTLQLMDGKILFISPTVSSVSLMGREDNFITVIASNQKQAELLAQQAIQKTKTIAVVYDLSNKLYTEEIYRYFKAAYERAGGQVVLAEPYMSEVGTKFSSLASKVLASGAQGVLIFASGMEAGILTQHLRKITPHYPIFTGAWSMTADFISSGGKYMEGVYTLAVFDDQSKYPQYRAFREEYMARYTDRPTLASVGCYDAAQVIFQSLRTSRNHSYQSIKESILSKKFDGLQGELIIDVNGDANRPYLLFTVQDGLFKRVES